MTADDLHNISVNNAGHKICAQDILKLSEKLAKLGRGGVILKGRLSSDVRQELADRGLGIAETRTDSEAIPVITAISWTL